MQAKPDELTISEDALPDIDDDEELDVLGEMEIAARTAFD